MPKDTNIGNEYNFNDHAHRYACWTAARAASVSRYSNTEIAGFVNQVSLSRKVNEVRENPLITHELYKEWFRKVVNELLFLMISNVNTQSQSAGKHRKASFGIAAKVVSVYLKTYEILPSNGQSSLSAVAFPPIDSFLLRKLKAGGFSGIVRTNWSTFDEAHYFDLIEQLRLFINHKPFWMLERYWDVNEEDSRKKMSVK